MDAKTKGIDLAPYVDWTERILDDPRALSDVYVPRKALERLWMTLAPTLSVSLPGQGLGRRGRSPAVSPTRGISSAAVHPDGIALADWDVLSALMQQAREATTAGLGLFDDALTMMARLMTEEETDGVSGTPPCATTGPRLSALNKTHLREARERLDVVLEQWEMQEGLQQEAVDGESGRPETVTDPAAPGVGSPGEVYRIAETETAGIPDDEDIRAVIRDTVQAELRTVVTQLTGKVY